MATDTPTMTAKLKVLLVPAATIGCGKTTTAHTLLNLLPSVFGVVSNDDFPSGGKGKQKFIRAGLQLLKEKQVVFLDRNYHMLQARGEILGKINKHRAEYFQDGEVIKVVCLDFLGNTAKSDQTWMVTTKRVLDRGDNHQSIKPRRDGAGFVKGIMRQFVNKYEVVDTRGEPDSLFDAVVRLKVHSSNSSLENAKVLLDSLQALYPELQSEAAHTDEEWSTAFKEALSYTPTYSKDMGSNSRQLRSREPPQRGQKNVLDMLQATSKV